MGGAGAGARHTTRGRAEADTATPAAPPQQRGEMEHLDSAERGCSLIGDKTKLFDDTKVYADGNNKRVGGRILLKKTFVTIFCFYKVAK